MHRPNVSESPPTIVASLNLRGPPRPPIVAVRSGTTSVQTSRFILSVSTGGGGITSSLGPRFSGRSNGTASITIRRYGPLAFQLCQTSDVHRLAPVEDSMDDDAEDENRQDQVEGKPQHHYAQHARHGD